MRLTPMILCELCTNSTDDRMQSSGWGWCRLCQHGTRWANYADIAGVYQTESYAAHNGDFEFLKTQWATNIELLKKHSGGPAVLDIGFLEGAGMASMTDAGFVVQGFDVSEAARAKAMQNGIASEYLRVASEFTSGLIGQTFDCVTCREVIEHVANPVRLVSEIKDTLKPNGIVQIQTPRFHQAVRFWECPEHLRCYSLGSLSNQIEMCGLSVIGAHLWDGGICLTARKECA